MRKLLFIILSLVVLGSAQAQEGGIKVNVVSVSGNKKTDATALSLQLSAKPGSVSQDTIDADVKALFGTGFFEQVEAVVSRDASGRAILKYNVVEKPVIRKVFIEGNDDVTTEDLDPVFDYRVGRFFDALQAKRASERVVSYYQGRGFYDAAVDYSIIPTGENQVDVTFKITEGDKYKIKDIEFVGLSLLDESDLTDKIQTTTYKWWSSWLTGSGRLNHEMLDNDRNIIRQELLNHGFVEGSAADPSIRKDGKGLYITFKIKEGPQYKLGKISSNGDLIENNSAVTLEGIESTEGEIFNGSLLRADSLKISEKFSDIGYAFVNVVPETNVNSDAKSVDVTFQVSKGNLVTVDRINVRGNQKTYDNVIRREMAIVEQDLFSSSKIKRSQELLLRRGYFEEVNVVPENIPNQDKVNLNVNVKEGSTGTLSVGAGYSTSDGVIFNTRVSENNVFGTGRRANLEVDIGDKRDNLVLSLDDPRVGDSQWSLGMDALMTEREYEDFDRDQVGGALTAGYDLESLIGRSGRDMRFSLRYQLIENEISNVDTEDAADFVIQEQGKALVSSIIPSITRNTIDNPLDPSSGSKQSLSVEYAGLGGDEEYYLVEANQQWYQPISKMGEGNLVFSWRTKFGYGDTFDNEPFPLFNRFFPGGINSVRGFKARRLGPKDSKGNEYGGSKQLVNNLELIFPISTSAGLKGIVFYDLGQAYDDEESLDLGELRHAAGYGIRWTSPLGPIRIEFGYPLDKEEGESSFVTLFSFGAPL